MDDASLPLLERTLPDGRPAFVKSAGPYARLLGASRQAGKNWNDSGLIAWVTDPATGNQIVDVAASDRRRHDQQNPLKRATPALAASGPSAPGMPADGPTLFTDRPDPASSRPLDQAAPRPSSAPVPPGTAGASPSDADPQQLRVHHQKEEGQELDNALKRVRLAKALGELVSLEERRAAETSRMRRLRDRLMALPVALADELNPGNPAHAQAILRRELRQMLEQLADELAADARREWGDVSDADTGTDEAAADDRESVPVSRPTSSTSELIHA
ncbi:MAG: hypothetical protein ACQRW7_11400 [Caulobacterales bacterium]|uniref:hypothetical protein n=1 Tax=Glycocaulis sp. TaxID=1969725 RepID=UPI003F9FE80D